MNATSPTSTHYKNTRPLFRGKQEVVMVAAWTSIQNLVNGYHEINVASIKSFYSTRGRVIDRDLYYLRSPFTIEPMIPFFCSDGAARELFELVVVDDEEECPQSL